MIYTFEKNVNVLANVATANLCSELFDSKFIIVTAF